MNPLLTAYLTQFEPYSSVDPLWDLARTYSILAEAFDRGICTGPVIDGAIKPQSAAQFARISRFAADLKHSYVAPRLQHLGASLSEFRRECVRYENSRQYRCDMIRITDLGPCMTLSAH